MKKIGKNVLLKLTKIWVLIVQVAFSIYFVFEPISGVEWLGLVSLNFSLISFIVLFVIAKSSIKDAAAMREKCRIETLKLAMSIVISHPDSDLSEKIVKSLNELLDDRLDK